MFRPFTNAVVAFMTSATVSTVLFTLPVTAEQLNDGRTFFDRSPKLVKATTSNPATQFSSVYTFTLTVPADVGQPLQAVTITQNHVNEKIEFDLNKSVAFAGHRYGVGERLPLASVGGFEPDNSQTATIVFNQPIEPGTTVTIALHARRNPNRGGTYLFGVTAYPVGESANGLFLGHGRLTFYENSR
jgi:hypothetical protein